MEGKGGEGIKGKGSGRGPTPKGMVGDLLLREVRGLLLRAPPTTDIGPLLTKSWLRAWVNDTHTRRRRPDLRLYIPGTAFNANVKFLPSCYTVYMYY